MDHFKAALIELTNAIEFIMDKHPICDDMAVRDRICDILQKTLMNGDSKQRPFWFYGAFNPIAEFRIRRALSEFLGNAAVQQLIAKDEETRLKELEAILRDKTVVSRTGKNLDYHLGEWAFAWDESE